ncbi:hypothetical protein EVAR_27956_1 [Eumeta japonica]|uniref:Uncharacterized protein n=1 Tax=Eumeta variegata TaxID=151549 RepID=A0A4C1ZSS0_EUMVA|nr:hypothetical protein EVAR_27956_1 [Eumeta japonica]
MTAIQETNEKLRDRSRPVRKNKARQAALVGNFQRYFNKFVAACESSSLFNIHGGTLERPLSLGAGAPSYNNSSYAYLGLSARAALAAAPTGARRRYLRWVLLSPRELGELSVYMQVFPDDVILMFARQSASSVAENENRSLAHVHSWGINNKLREIRPLNLTIDRKVTLTLHVAKVCKKATNTYKGIARAAKETCDLSPENVRTIYNAVIVYRSVRFVRLDTSDEEARRVNDA